MPRGHEWGLYIDDDGTGWSVLVDADYFAQPERGWATVGDPAPPPLSRMWFPRRVVGIDETGRQITCIVARITADLWTGVQRVFSFNASDQLAHNATVFRYDQELRRGRPHQ